MTFRQLKFYLQANWVKTIYFNLRIFPFCQAIKLPVLLFGPCSLNIGRMGQIQFTDGKKKFASVLVGNSFTELEKFNSRHFNTYISIKGTLKLSGSKQTIGNGCKIIIDPDAVLSIGDHVIINNMTKIVCQKEIIIGDLTSISWECQFFDTNFHYIVNEDGSVAPKYGKIFIGRNCWIGNRCTIQKNTFLNDYSTLASNSIINKNFSEIHLGTFAGAPAKNVAVGKIRVRNAFFDIKLDEYFLKHPDVKKIIIDLEESKKYNTRNEVEITPI